MANSTSSRRFLWGLVLIMLGVLLLMDNFRMLDFSDFVHDFWPLIFIIIGVSILFRRHDRTVGRPEVQIMSEFQGKQDSSSDLLDYSSVFGDVDIHATSASLRGGTISTVFGDTAVDLTGASLTDGEATLSISGVFGNVRVTIPPDMPCSITANATLGKVRVNDQKTDGVSAASNYTSPDYASATKKLRLTISQVFGDVTVTR